MVAPFAAGGSTDAIARIVADGLSSQLHQPVIVENIAGAGGMTGTNRVAKAVPDGYQFVLGNVGTHAQNQSLYKKPLYDAVTDFAPVALITDQSLVLVARNDFPANNLQEFIAYAKANQSKLRYSSAGVGGSNHLACVLLNSAIGIDVTHIPYRSGGQAMQDLLAARVDYQCPSLAGSHAADRRQDGEGVRGGIRRRYGRVPGPWTGARPRRSRSAGRGRSCRMTTRWPTEASSCRGGVHRSVTANGTACARASRMWA